MANKAQLARIIREFGSPVIQDTIASMARHGTEVEDLPSDTLKLVVDAISTDLSTQALMTRLESLDIPVMAG